MYGIVDAWIGSEKDGVGAKSVTKLNSGGFNSSRFGLQGSEDLGGGLKATFNIEHRFAADGVLQLDGGDDVDQRIQHGPALWRRRQQQALAGGTGRAAGCGLQPVQSLGLLRSRSGLGQARAVAPRQPGRMDRQRRQQQHAGEDEPELQPAHGRRVPRAFRPIRPWRRPLPCPRPRCARHPAPAWSRR
ncbi:MAG: porin [Hylemonella sp.]